MNMFWEPLDFEVPLEPRRVWRVAVNTFAPTPAPAQDPIGPPLESARCRVEPRSIVILAAG